MGKDFESRFQQHQPEGQFPYAKSLKLPFELGMPNAGILCATPCANEAPMSDPLPPCGLSGQPNFNGNGTFKEPHGRFYIPDTNFFDNDGVANVPLIDPPRAPKQFLVFDQTGNKTTLILSSMIGGPNHLPNSWNREKFTGYHNVSGGELGNRTTELFSGPDLTDENVISEMHEDSEDIDALLFSDDEDNFTDDGEETSTGRSPSIRTAYSAGPSKRKKLSDISYEVPSVTYTFSSPKSKGSLEYEDDAESSCSGGPPTTYDNMGLLSGTKRERKEKILETVSVLRTILPDGNGKDAVVVLDEAINYLKSLRFAAKSLGISGL